MTAIQIITILIIVIAILVIILIQSRNRVKRFRQEREQVILENSRRITKIHEGYSVELSKIMTNITKNGELMKGIEYELRAEKSENIQLMETIEALNNNISSMVGDNKRVDKVCESYQESNINLRQQMDILEANLKAMYAEQNQNTLNPDIIGQMAKDKTSGVEGKIISIGGTFGAEHWAMLDHGSDLHPNLVKYNIADLEILKDTES